VTNKEKKVVVHGFFTRTNNNKSIKMGNACSNDKSANTVEKENRTESPAEKPVEEVPVVEKVEEAAVETVETTEAVVEEPVKEEEATKEEDVKSVKAVEEETKSVAEKEVDDVIDALVKEEEKPADDTQLPETTRTEE
jgi:hypothetical protein